MAEVNLARASVVVVLVGLGLTGCSGSSAAVPTAPTAALTPPSVSTLSVSVGSTKGGTPLRIVGAGFQMGATATFGTAKVSRWGWDPRVAGGASGSLLINTPEHGEGLVDLIITNPDGQSVRIANAFEYQPPQAFDVNGGWEGYGSDGNHISMAITIRNNVLVSASCSYDTLTPFFCHRQLPTASSRSTTATVSGFQDESFLRQTSSARSARRRAAVTFPGWRTGRLAKIAG